MTIQPTHRLAWLALLFTSTLAQIGCGSQPVAGGIENNKLSACGDKPNCISSTNTDEDHLYPVLKYTGTAEAAKNKLVQTINNYPRTRIVSQDDQYIHVEFTTKLMRFVDDGEFLVGEDNVQVRSASRVGYSDMGKNRSRMDEIKAAFEPCCDQ
ncbi:MAG: DUF1499 domain-containing protein [Ketobacter sp.]|nr:MAG: DUF1499 domain-containing protein [Ketobacter sp.]